MMDEEKSFIWYMKQKNAYLGTHGLIKILIQVIAGFRVHRVQFMTFLMLKNALQKWGILLTFHFQNS